MPVITLDVAPLSMAQKAALAAELTDVATRHIDLPKETFYVFFRELPPENIGVGGKLLNPPASLNKTE